MSLGTSYLSRSFAVHGGDEVSLSRPVHDASGSGSTKHGSAIAKLRTLMFGVCRHGALVALEGKLEVRCFGLNKCHV